MVMPVVTLVTFAAASQISGSERHSARLYGGRGLLFRLALRYTFPAAVGAAFLGGLVMLADSGCGQIMGYHGVAGEVLVAFAAKNNFQLAALKAVVTATVFLPLLVIAGWALVRYLNFESLAKQGTDGEDERAGPRGSMVEGIAAGEHVVLTGPSGSGKSTLLRLIAGLEAPSSGVIKIEGESASEGSTIIRMPVQRGLTMVFQDLGLWPNLTVYGNVKLGLSALKGSRRAKRDAISAALRDCQLDCLLRRKPARLSSGEQQRVALARALVCKPRILLLDEPFAALDILLKQELFRLIRNLVKEREISVLTVTHNPSDAIGLQADRIVVIEDGALVEDVALGDIETGVPRSRILRAWKDDWPLQSQQSTN